MKIFNLKLSYFIVQFGTGIIGLAFFIAIAFTKKNKPKYFDYIFIFIILGLLISFNTIVNNYNSWQLNMKIPILIEQILLLFQFFFIGCFFIRILNEPIIKKRIKIAIILSISIQTALIIFILSTNIEIKPVLTSCLFSLVFCYMYFKDLMSKKPTLNLLNSSSFWIVMGILYSSCIGIPVHALITFIPRNSEFINLRRHIFSITNMSLIVFYIFIIKSYLCLKHPQNL